MATNRIYSFLQRLKKKKKLYRTKVANNSSNRDLAMQEVSLLVFAITRLQYY